MDRIRVELVDFGKVGMAQPLSWWRSNKNVWMVCANGHPAILDHDITTDGEVSPSVVCPENGCSFHEWVVLDAYDKSTGEG